MLMNLQTSLKRRKSNRKENMSGLRDLGWRSADPRILRWIRTQTFHVPSLRSCQA